MYKTNSNREITYNGREYTNDIKSINNEYNINSIDELFSILLEVWCKDTTYPSCKLDYNYDNDPSYGQCAITAILVHDIFGGTIHKIKVDGGTHYFNKINNHYIDLTSDQFTLYNILLDYEDNVEKTKDECLKNEDTLNRYNLLKELVKKH